MPKPARSRQRPSPRPLAPAGEPAEAGPDAAIASPRSTPARPIRRATGASYTPPDYSYVGQDVIRILVLSGALIVAMVVLSKVIS